MWLPSGYQIFCWEMQKCQLKVRLLSSLNVKHDLQFLPWNEKTGTFPGCGSHEVYPVASIC